MTVLKDAARYAAEEIRRERKRLEEHPDIVLIAKWRAEVVRLRDYILARARAIHTEVSAIDIDCGCPGCVLLLGMDDVPLPSDLGAIA
jgi:hypothetical protein